MATNKWIVAIIAGLLFMAISSPFAYQQTDKLARMISPRISLASFQGLPTIYGLALHAIIYVFIVRLIMF